MTRRYRHATLTEAFKTYDEDEAVRRVGAEMERNGAVKVGTSHRQVGHWMETRHVGLFTHNTRYEDGVKVWHNHEHWTPVN